MKVLITGGAGFIGSHIVDRLLARGDRVMVIDNFSTGRRDNLKSDKNLDIIEGTIADVELVKKSFDEFQPEQVIHTAASYKNPDNWNEDVITNVLGSANIVKESKRLAVKRLIYFQTALCYGLHPQEQPITLEHAIHPEYSSYAITKTAGEGFVFYSGLDNISFRLANAYGPRNLSGPLPTFFNRLTNNQSCFVTDTRRDFIFVQDLVDLVMMAIDGKGAAGIYHISSGSDYAIKELFDATIKALDIKPAPEVEVRKRGPDDAYTILLDPSKTQNTFGWKATTPLDTGVGEAIRYYREYGITQTYTHLKSD